MMSATVQDRIEIARRDEFQRLESHLQNLFSRRIRHLRLVDSEQGIVLQGTAHSYYAKQLVQHALMQATELIIAANQIEVV